MLKQKVYEAFREALGTKEITLLNPTRPEFGDFAVNIHRFESASWRRDSKVENVIKKLAQNELFEKIEQKGSFINVFIKIETLLNELQTIQKKQEKYGYIDQKGIRINLEYGDPNTHKLPHIGHLFSYVVGESWARILEATGNTIYRCCYQGDVGPHVAKCLYGIQSSGARIQDLEKKSLEERVSLLQKAYQEGSKVYKEDPKAKGEIDEINKKIYEGEPLVRKLWETTRSWSLEYYQQFEMKLDISYDQHYFESQTSDLGKKIVQQHLGNIFEESEGAVVFRGEKHNLHTRVFITTLGTPTYEAKDLALVTLKAKDWPFEKAIITTASEQNEYFKVVIKAIEEVHPEFKDKISHIGFGLIDLKSGKMSSRTGNIISAMDLVANVKKIVQNDLLSENKDDKTADIISLGAVKFAFLKSEARKNILFDIEESVSLKGNSGPYLQYAKRFTQWRMEI